jgi:DNA-directed RNA polymerase subunit RPC12/RpoP
MSDHYEEPQLANAGGQQFRCPSCNANMQFDAAQGMLACEYCGATVPIGHDDGGQSIVEYDLAHGIAMSAQRGYGTEVRRTRCSECGATVNLGGNVTADHCDFCGSPQVLVQEENRNILRPESLVPFAVNADTSKEKFREWLKGLWFRPNALKAEAHVKDLAGVYVPYWTYDSMVDSDWTAQAGYYYYVSETYTTQDANGNTVTQTRQVRKVRWQPAWGSRRDHYDDILVCASQGLPADLVNRLRTFNTAALVPYQSQYLAGWRAEEYAVELNDGWRNAVGTMESEQRRRCGRDVPGDTQRALNVRNRFYQSTYKHVLLPIWISSYRYRDKVYRFLVNGQTGEVTGTAPYSWLKITLFVLFWVALIGGLIFWYQTTR